MRVLVAYGTTGDGTGEIAGWIAEELRACGLQVDVVPAAEVADITEYAAVVLGSGVYAAGWHAGARQFVHRYAGLLAGRPVWLFSSGPLDTSADDGPLPPGRHAEEAMRRLPARAHVTFGGRMTSEAHGWLGHLAGLLARQGHAGDFRSPDRVRAWARDIAADLMPPG